MRRQEAGRGTTRPARHAVADAAATSVAATSAAAACRRRHVQATCRQQRLHREPRDAETPPTARRSEVALIKKYAYQEIRTGYFAYQEIRNP